MLKVMLCIFAVIKCMPLINNIFLNKRENQVKFPQTAITVVRVKPKNSQQTSI